MTPPTDDDPDDDYDYDYDYDMIAAGYGCIAIISAGVTLAVITLLHWLGWV